MGDVEAGAINPGEEAEESPRALFCCARAEAFVWIRSFVEVTKDPRYPGTHTMRRRFALYLPSNDQGGPPEFCTAIDFCPFCGVSVVYA